MEAATGNERRPIVVLVLCLLVLGNRKLLECLAVRFSYRFCINTIKQPCERKPTSESIGGSDGVTKSKSSYELQL